MAKDHTHKIFPHISHQVPKPESLTEVHPGRELFHFLLQGIAVLEYSSNTKRLSKEFSASRIRQHQKNAGHTLPYPSAIICPPGLVDDKGLGSGYELTTENKMVEASADVGPGAPSVVC